MSFKWYQYVHLWQDVLPESRLMYATQRLILSFEFVDVLTTEHKNMLRLDWWSSLKVKGATHRN